MSNKINVGVTVNGEGNRRGPLRQITLEVVTEWIKLQGFDEYTTNGLIEMASRYPTQALPSFRRNFNLMIQRVRQKRKQEQGEDVSNVVQKPIKQSEPIQEERGSTSFVEVIDTRNGSDHGPE